MAIVIFIITRLAHGEIRKVRNFGFFDRLMILLIWFLAFWYLLIYLILPFKH